MVSEQELCTVPRRMLHAREYMTFVALNVIQSQSDRIGRVFDDRIVSIRGLDNSFVQGRRQKTESFWCPF